MIKLTIHYPDQPPQKLKINTFPFTVGRAPENDLTLDYPFVSASHAVIEQTADGFEVKDRDSTNGLLVEENRLKVVPLTKDVLSIYIGSIRLEFSQRSKEMAATTVFELGQSSLKKERSLLGQSLVLIALIVSSFAVHGLDFWKTSYDKAWRELFLPFPFSLAGWALMALVLSVITKINNGKYRFLCNFQFVIGFTAALSLYSLVSPSIVYNSGGGVLSSILYSLLLIGIVFGGILIFLRILSPFASKRQRWKRALSLSVLFGAAYFYIVTESYYSSDRFRMQATLGLPLIPSSWRSVPQTEVGMQLDLSAKEVSAYREEMRDKLGKQREDLVHGN